jgi:hypothetical protein
MRFYSGPTCNQNVIAFQARNKPADGGGHVNQKGQAGQKTPVAGQKSGQTKAAQKPAQKPPTAQKGQVKTQPKAAAVKGGKKTKKGQRHQQHDLIVTINLVSRPHHCIHEPSSLVSPSILDLPTLHFLVDHNQFLSVFFLFLK